MTVPFFTGPNDAGELRAYLNMLALEINSLGTGGGGGVGGDVNVVSISGQPINLGQTIGDNSLPFALASDEAINFTGTAAISGDVGLLAGTQLVGKVGFDQTTPGTTNGVQVNAALPAGANLLGKIGIDQTTPGTTNAVQIVPGTTGGWTTKSNIIPGNTTGILVKTGAGLLGHVQAFNLGSVPLFIHWYDAVTVTGTPIWRTVIPGPASGGGGYIATGTVGLGFSTGLIYYVSTVITDGDATAPVASTSIVNIGFK